MLEPLGIALVGCGNVGSAVAQLLSSQGDRLARRAGRRQELRHIVVANLGKPRPEHVPLELLTTDAEKAIGDPNVQLVVELIGGTTRAKEIVLAALAAGKDVVTANKALLAEHGTEVYSAARKHGRTVAFEGSVGGGIPVVGALAQGLAANQITRLQGILNGTCNYILSAMSERGSDYGAALAEAQRSGFAETDPTLDVDGSDTAHKLAILTRIAFGVAISPTDIERRGIVNVSPLDVRLAHELGCVIKLIADAGCCNDELTLQVGPELIHRGTPLADVNGAYNAVRIIGDPVGDTLFYGSGAGALPTASAVIADIIDMALGRAKLTFDSLRLWEPSTRIRLSSNETAVSRYYLRLTVADRPGVLAEAAGLLAMENISIAEVIQHEAADNGVTSLVITTHPATASKLHAAIRRIEQSAAIREPVVYYPMSA